AKYSILILGRLRHPSKAAPHCFPPRPSIDLFITAPLDGAPVPTGLKISSLSPQLLTAALSPDRIPAPDTQTEMRIPSPPPLLHLGPPPVTVFSLFFQTIPPNAPR